MSERQPCPSAFVRSLLKSDLFVACIGMLAAASVLPAQTPTLDGCQVFPANNVWNTRVDSLPVAANSNALVSTIGSGAVIHPDFSTNLSYGLPVTAVSGNQPKVAITFGYASESDPGPYPIPANVQIEGGSDHHILLVDTSNCILYEVYNATSNGNGTWHASSGAVYHLNSNTLRPAGWTSADAAGLPVIPGLIRYDEVASGHINHALRFTAPVSAASYIWPARHDASSLLGSAYSPMGQRFRLKSSFNISGFSPQMQVILTALKQYGMILADNGGPWFVSGISDTRWNDNDLDTLTQIAGSNLEAVDESSLVMDSNSGQAVQPGSSKTPAPTVPTNTWVHVLSKNSGKCLEVRGGVGATQAAAGLDQWTCTGAANQSFELTPVSGTAGYKITAKNSGLQLDVFGQGTSDGTAVIQWPFWGGANETWNVQPTADGYFTVSPESTNKCMDVSGVSVADGAEVWQWTCLGTDNQKWSFATAQ